MGHISTGSSRQASLPFRSLRPFLMLLLRWALGALPFLPMIRSLVATDARYLALGSERSDDTLHVGESDLA
jgi:hypothetical protein